MALLVGARVTLAHGEGTAFEARRWPYLPFAGLILLASLARTSVLWTPRTYFLHLAYAAIVWSLGALLWGWVFLPRIGKELFAKK